MRRHQWRQAWTVIALLAGLSACRRQPAATPVASTGQIDAVVRDRAGQPLAGALIGVNGSNYVGRTTAGGQYRFADVPPGRFTVTAQQAGVGAVSGTVEVAAGRTARLELRFAP